ncbi:MAG: glycosyltransferase family 4 protein [Deltaproteobacteria bacterium]|nr:glycosyltransferase family 4 protein [Deltaproteobacteria bacterium]
MYKGLILTQNPDIPETALIKALAEEFHITVLSKNSLSEVNARFLAHSFNNKFDIRALFKIKDAYDFALCFDGKCVTTAILLKIFKKVRSLFVYRGTPSGGNWLDPISWLTFRSPWIDKIIVNCHHIKNYFITQGLAPEKICVIYKGHESKWYERTNPYRGGDFVTILNYRKSKGLENVICFVKKFFPRSSLTVFGRIPEAIKKRYSNNVRFEGYREQPFAFLPSFKIFILLSEKEGIPKSAVEATFKGLPLILYDTGGISEIWSNNDAVILNDINEVPTPTISLIEELLCNEQKRRELNEKALQKVESKLDFRTYVYKHIELIYNALSGKK